MSKFTPMPKIKASKKVGRTKATSMDTWTAQYVTDDRTGVTSLAVIYDHAIYGRHFAFVDADLTDSPRAVRKELKKLGARFTGSKADQVAAIGAMLGSIPTNHGSVTSKPGFKNERGFVLGERMIGQGATRYRWRPSDKCGDGLGRRKGTLKDWKVNVAKLLKQSTYGTVAVCFALAACLPSYINLKRKKNPDLELPVSETMTLNFSGPSGSGKTTLSRVVAGLYGAPMMHDWDFTPTSLEEMLASSNDLVLVLDDTETYLNERPTLKEQLRRVNEKIPAGRAKARSRANGIQSYTDLTWTTFGISSSPKPLHELADALSWNRTPGESVRFVDIAVRRPERGGIFDTALGEQKEHAALSSQLVRKLEAASHTYYGTALPAFVEMLLSEDKAADVIRLTTEFAAKVGATTGWDCRLAKKFGICYAAGTLAAKAGILPWTEKWILKAVRRCYQRALVGMKSDEELSKAKIVGLQIASTDPVRFPKATKGGKPILCTAQTIGVRTKYKERPAIAIRSEGLRTAIGTNTRADALAKFMNDKGLLIGKHGKKLTTQLPVRLKIDGKIVPKPRFYVLDARKLATYVKAT